MALAPLTLLALLTLLLALLALLTLLLALLLRLTLLTLLALTLLALLAGPHRLLILVFAHAACSAARRLLLSGARSVARAGVLLPTGACRLLPGPPFLSRIALLVRHVHLLIDRRIERSNHRAPAKVRTRASRSLPISAKPLFSGRMHYFRLIAPAALFIVAGLALAVLARAEPPRRARARSPSP